MMQEATPRTEIVRDTDVRALTEKAVMSILESPGTERDAWNGGVFHTHETSALVKETGSSS